MLGVVAGVAVIAAAMCAVFAVSFSGGVGGVDGSVTADAQPVQERELVCLHCCL